MSTTTIAPAETAADAPQARRLRRFLSARLAPLAATIAGLAAIAGGTSSEAEAGVRFADSAWANATLTCNTYPTFDGRSKTQSLKVTLTADSGIWLQTQLYINGNASAASEWSPMTTGTYSHILLQRTVASSTGGASFSLLVRFAKLINGQWQFSDNGYFQYADHYTASYGWSTETLRSCTWR